MSASFSLGGFFWPDCSLPLGLAVHKLRWVVQVGWAQERLTLLSGNCSLGEGQRWGNGVLLKVTQWWSWNKTSWVFFCCLFLSALLHLRDYSCEGGRGCCDRAVVADLSFGRSKQQYRFCIVGETEEPSQGQWEALAGYLDADCPGFLHPT